MKNKKEEKLKILMCGSDLSVKGGIVSVIKNYLQYNKWDDFEIIFLPTHIDKNKFVKIIFFIKNLLKITYLCALKKIDIVHLHVSERGSIYRKIIIANICKKMNVKVIFHHHGAEFEEFYWSLNIKKQEYINKILEKIDLNIVLSKGLVSNIVNKAPNANIKVLYNAVETYESNQYNCNGNIILFLGRLGERKGVFDLVEVIKVLDDIIDKNICFCLCGDGEIEVVKKLIKNYNLDHRVSHIGWIEKEKKKEIFSKCIINVLPSYKEGLPMTILETMSFGIPNISTNIASIPEVINSELNGYLIEPGDIYNLSKRIEELTNNKVLREEFSKNSFKLINEKFSLDKHIELLKSIWKEI